MNSKPFFLPVLFAFSLGAFAADAPKPSATPSVPLTLETILPNLTEPFTKDSLQWLMALQKLSADSARPGAARERAAFASALCVKAADAKLPATVRAQVLRQIALIGGSESIEPLTVLLSDPDAHLRDYARQALELNSDPRASAVLLDALKKGGDARWQAGFIHSLGERRVAAAVETLVIKLKEADCAKAVLIALGKIGNAEAVRGLQAALPSHPALAGDALLSVAQKLPSADAGSIAANILAAKESSPSQRAVALKLLAVADPAAARKELPVAIGSSNPRLQSAAVAAAIALDGKQKAVAALIPQWTQLHTAGKIALLQAVEPGDEKAVLALPIDTDENVQKARITTLGRIGSAASVPALLQLAGDAPRAGTPVANALSVINGPGADEALRAAAAKGDPKARALAISVLGWRGSKAAAPDLVRYAADPLPVISRAACLALKSIGSDSELLPLVDLLLTGNTPNAATAVRGIASRSLDCAPAVAKVVAKAKQARGNELLRALDAMSVLGGNLALATVVDYTRAPEPETVAGAVQALSNWPDFEAVTPLLTLGADAKLPERLRIVALRATEQIILAAPPTEVSFKEKVDAAVGLLHAATRPEEKSLAVSILGSIPNRVAGEALIKLLPDAATKEIATQACLNLAEKLVHKDRGSAKKLALAVQKTNPNEALTKRAAKIVEKSSAR